MAQSVWEDEYLFLQEFFHVEAIEPWVLHDVGVTGSPQTLTGVLDQ